MRVLRVAAATALAAGALTLTGCAGAMEAIAQSGAGQMLQGGSGQRVDITYAGGGGAVLPVGFPDEIPVPDDDPTYALADEAGWQVVFEIDAFGDAQDVVDGFEPAGFTPLNATRIGQLGLWNFESDRWAVTLTVLVPMGSTTQMIYMVADAPSA